MQRGRFKNVRSNRAPFKYLLRFVFFDFYAFCVIFNILKIQDLSMILILLLIMFFSTAHADSVLNQLMEKLQKKYENLGTLKATFTQSYSSRRFSDRIQENGVVYLRKGGYMKWEYQKPEEKIFLSDGRYYLYYVAEDKQLIKAAMDPHSDQRSPALFLTGRGNFLKDFRAEWADPRPGSHLVKLTPLNPQPDFRYMIVDVDPVSVL